MIKQSMQNRTKNHSKIDLFFGPPLAMLGDLHFRLVWGSIRDQFCVHFGVNIRFESDWKNITKTVGKKSSPGPQDLQQTGLWSCKSLTDTSQIGYWQTAYGNLAIGKLAIGRPASDLETPHWCPEGTVADWFVGPSLAPWAAHLGPPNR